MDKKEWIELAEKAMKHTRSYRENQECGIADSENFQVAYILTNGDTPQDAVAYAAHEDEIIFFSSLTDDENAFEGYEVLFWLGDDLFEWLVKCHWNFIAMYGRILKATEMIIKYKTAYSCI